MDKKELYEKTEKALNQAFETAKQSVKVLSEKAGEAAQVTKLLIEKATLEHRINKKFTDLGHRVYDMASDGGKTVSLEEEAVQKVIAETKDFQKQLSEVESKIEAERKSSK